jgi:hypothetical protein
VNGRRTAGRAAAGWCTVTHPAEEEGHGIVRRGSVRASVMVAVTVVAVSSCGGPAPTQEASASPHPSISARSSAAAGPCASVITTTPIGQVPSACAALWAPYGVTKVPPANLTDSTPVPPSVVNGTAGAVSDADAQSWALAANRTGVWLRWSEANDQYSLTTRIESSHVVNATLDALMRNGTSVIDPPCDLFAQKYLLFPMTPDGSQFFSSFGEVTHDAYVLVEHYPGPCAIVGTSPDGGTQTVAATPNLTVSISAGTLLHDPVLGILWFADGAAFCTDRGAPTSWCNQ